MILSIQLCGQRLCSHQWRLCGIVHWVCIFALVLTASDRSIAGDQSNVLLIVVDDLNDFVGCLGGHPQVQTPNIDRLAKQGVLFANAHCAAPLCNPSRAAIFSGQYPYENGVYANDERDIRKDRPDLILIPEHFRRQGYATFGAGKLLHQKNKGLYSEEFYPEQRWSPFSPEQVVYTLDEQPSKSSANPKHATELNGSPIVLPLNRLPSDRAPDSDAGESFDWGPLDIDDQAMGDSKVAQWSATHLSRSHERPFLVAVGFYRPHIPLFAPKRYFDMYDNVEIQLPVVRSDDLDDLSATGRKWALEAVSAGAHQTVVQNNQWRAAVKAYLACVTYVDAQIGSILKSLEAGPNAANTTVIFLSDHGWHLGEKQHWGKWTGWQRSTHVPLIIVPPRSNSEVRRGSVCHVPVSLVDIYPTLVEMCRLPSPGRLSGESLVPLIKNPDLKSDRRVITTFDRDNYSVTSPRWRYIRYSDGAEELYDQQADPHEWHNLANAPQHASIKSRLARDLPHMSTPTPSNPQPGIPNKKTKKTKAQKTVR